MAFEKKAVILAGGKGTRLRPYTVVFPKPLVPIGERPILELIVRQLRSHGFQDLTFAVNHLAELIRAFFGDGKSWNVDINYSLEQHPLGTAGPLGLITGLSENFLVMNGDILTDINYSDFWQNHIDSNAIATIATCFKEVPISLGVLDVSERGQLVGYTEKPILKYRVSMGMYVFQRRILDYIKPNVYLDLPDLMKLLIKEGEKVNSYNFAGSWLDIGNPDDYALANERFSEQTDSFLQELT
ncbi:sugar phosphate nucleotidyltransferase [Leptolyngbya sp. KIOST-1]|uniref:sugar phosphate nucleotidyltransferase n=1 Tax=Leptolyngbya sp. KIOST-1 TaxID=1229172 RepID=UPI000907AC4F|nr:sugar phosphate nucleotidyltransferase [Leptolyngbya sp. KIOST-1]